MSVSLLSSMIRARSMVRFATMRSFSVVPVTAGLVKELREKSGAPMMECKKALSDPTVEGDISKAMDWLRAKGIARASNQADKATAAGVVAVYCNGNQRTLVEINSETDFVCRNAQFHDFVRSVCATAGAAPAGVVSVAEILNSLIPPQSIANEDQKDRLLNDHLIDIISIIRENIVIRRVENFQDAEALSAVYLHGKVCDDIVDSQDSGKSIQIGVTAGVVTVTSQGSAATEEVSSCARKLAMHVVAASPLFLAVKDAPLDVHHKETKIAQEQVLADAIGKKAKPVEVIDKIILGKVNKRIGEMSLLTQSNMVEAGGPVVEKFLKSKNIEVNSFARWAVEQ